MFMTLEVSRHFQWKPGFFRMEGVTTFRIWWLWFAIALHPMRYDELVDMATEGYVTWDGG